MTGQLLFSGFLTTNSANIKAEESEKKDNKPRFSCKLACVVQKADKTCGIEHCQVVFLSESERANFIKVYGEKTRKNDDWFDNE